MVKLLENISLIVDSKIAVQKLSNQLAELDRINSLLDAPKKPYDEFTDWRLETSKTLDSIFSSKTISRDFLTETFITLNKFSDIESLKKLELVVKTSKSSLEYLTRDILSDKFISNENKSLVIDKSTALVIIRRILRNFYKHIESMYQYEVHGSAKIKKEDLDNIRIGNEYDVQRILYSLIRPVFPEARLETVDDAGYNSVRYDIVISEYDIVIEVKCTRNSMTERTLTEELGSDSFHYKADHLFLFIFDRVKLIKNLDVFEKSFTRIKKEAGKEIETFVIQEVSF